MTEFTPIQSLVGGALIGLASVLMLVFHGRIAGISGIVGNLLGGWRDQGWRLWFLVGLLAGGVSVLTLAPNRFGGGVPASIPTLALAGVLVGVGTRLGGGCTSGHGVCGVSRLSVRSLVATATFMLVAGITVYVTRHVMGAA